MSVPPCTPYVVYLFILDLDLISATLRLVPMSCRMLTGACLGLRSDVTPDSRLQAFTSILHYGGVPDHAAAAETSARERRAPSSQWKEGQIKWGSERIVGAFWDSAGVFLRLPSAHPATAPFRSMLRSSWWFAFGSDWCLGHDVVTPFCRCRDEAEGRLQWPSLGGQAHRQGRGVRTILRQAVRRQGGALHRCRGSPHGQLPADLEPQDLLGG